MTLPILKMVRRLNSKLREQPASFAHAIAVRTTDSAGHMGELRIALEELETVIKVYLGRTA